MNQMTLKAGVPVQVGPIQGVLYGGPFRKYVPGTRRLIGVKMAAEIDHPHDVSVPTEDYSIPDADDMTAGLIEALRAMKNGNDVYVGCMGGIGRTGLFMGCMAKVMADWETSGSSDDGPDSTLDHTLADPVAWVRANYIPHAIETKQQQAFVREFDSAPVLRWVETNTGPLIREVEVVKEVVTYPAPWEYMLHCFGFKCR